MWVLSVLDMDELYIPGYTRNLYESVEEYEGL